MEISALAGNAISLQQESDRQHATVAMIKSAAEAQNQVAGLLEQSAAAGKAAVEQGYSFSVYA
jgi:hypothetical protein